MFKFEAPKGAGGEMLQHMPTFRMETCRGGNCVFGHPTCQVLNLGLEFSIWGYTHLLL